MAVLALPMCVSRKSSSRYSTNNKEIFCLAGGPSIFLRDESKKELGRASVVVTPVKSPIVPREHPQQLERLSLTPPHASSCQPIAHNKVRFPLHPAYLVIENL